MLYNAILCNNKPYRVNTKSGYLAVNKNYMLVFNIR